jgi:hypothetical protein
MNKINVGVHARILQLKELLPFAEIVGDIHKDEYFFVKNNGVILGAAQKVDTAIKIAINKIKYE